ncbi:glycosyltransferase [Candidatus Enterovibrio escicola]|uniref:Glycosyltransferase n=1 Tax=Candidatus Enterovibrio escicola TaxID=1927127 RepID=A0A2A5T3T4_9GAMM|nr:glycosyltransferase [Candidatus Enterovibrio escacola]PCS22814.1 Glycosyltransferase [Candidatus Enterovibrio escacola]
MTDNKQRPKVAVAIATYNHDCFIIECLNSVLKQDYRNIDIYISDDFSQDETRNVLLDFLESYSGKRNIFSFIETKNIGIAGNFNKLIQRVLMDSDIDFIIPFAGDDLMIHNKVSKQVEHLLNNPNSVFCYSNMEWFSNNSNKKILNHFNLLLKPSCKIDRIISEALVPTPTLCFRRKVLEKLRYNEKFPYVNDYLLVVEAAMLGEVIYINEPLVKYRKHESSTMETVLFLNERRDVSEFIYLKYGFKEATIRFARTADYDFLVKSLKEKKYKDAFLKFLKLFPTFFSSRKWVLRLIKIIMIVSNMETY